MLECIFKPFFTRPGPLLALYAIVRPVSVPAKSRNHSNLHLQFFALKRIKVQYFNVPIGANAEVIARTARSTMSLAMNMSKLSN